MGNNGGTPTGDLHPISLCPCRAYTRRSFGRKLRCASFAPHSFNVRRKMEPMAEESKNSSNSDDQRYPLNVELPSLKSLFIETFFGDQLLSTGTATLVSNDHGSHCALITNRHNVTGRHQETGECLSKTLGVPDNIVIHFHKPGKDIGNWLKVKLPLHREIGRAHV